MMRKIGTIVLLVIWLLASCISAQADSGWTCPICGRYNDNNYCPNDATPRSSAWSGSSGGSYGSTSQYASVYATLNQRLATRTGPSTKYDEPGSFLSAGKGVTVHAKAYDTANGIWWVLVEFTDNGASYWAYTGAKRFSNLNLNQIPEERIIGTCSVRQSTEAYYGPSNTYKTIRQRVPAGVRCDIYGYVRSNYGSNYFMIDFYDSSLGCRRRAWVADWSVSNCSLYNGY